jgi:hypothetical protein
MVRGGYDTRKATSVDWRPPRPPRPPFKRDAIPKSAGTVKKSTLFRKFELYLKK